MQNKIKTSKILDDMLYNLSQIDHDAFAVEDVLLAADYYTVDNKSGYKDHDKTIIKLYKKSNRTGMPMYKISYYNGYAYFINDIREIKKIIKKAELDSAK